jgi:hypothetical protein
VVLSILAELGAATISYNDHQVLDQVAERLGIDRGSQVLNHRQILDNLDRDPRFEKFSDRAVVGNRERVVRGFQVVSGATAPAREVVPCTLCHLSSDLSDRRAFVAGVFGIAAAAVSEALIRDVEQRVATWTSQLTTTQHRRLAQYYGLHGEKSLDLRQIADLEQTHSSTARNSRDLALEQIRRSIHQHEPALLTAATASPSIPGDPLFWDKVERTDGCWYWRGTLDKSYGVVKRARKVRLVHRYAWELMNGPIPQGKQVAHNCGTHTCVRPEHLILIDPGELQAGRR